MKVKFDRYEVELGESTKLEATGKLLRIDDTVYAFNTFENASKVEDICKQVQKSPFVYLIDAVLTIESIKFVRYLKDGINGTKFEPIRFGDNMTIQDWLGGVNCTMFTDYDGHGYLSTETEESNIRIEPSDVYDGNYEFPEWCTHISWYNK